ncbi:cilia- and flagella-associated protein 90 [Trichomycterus rosablanca]|uniref:cilia- and flagella-associated protein 90 n=1 Tax=Trichomycterus rosablanca TaxID=2290929 RepID=UPI002F35BDF5
MDLISQAESKPLSSLSVFSFIPARRSEPKERTYFNSNSKAPEIYSYDCVHHRAEGFNNKLHRDDRVHAKSHGLDLHSEELSRPVAVRSSSEYGRRLPALSHKPNRQFARVAHIRAEFYRKNGITTVEEAYGSVAPA